MLHFRSNPPCRFGGRALGRLRAALAFQGPLYDNECIYRRVQSLLRCIEVALDTVQMAEPTQLLSASSPWAQHQPSSVLYRLRETNRKQSTEICSPANIHSSVGDTSKLVDSLRSLPHPRCSDASFKSHFQSFADSKSQAH